MHVDRLRHRCKPRLADFEPIRPIGETLQRQGAFIVCAEGAPVLIRLADNLDRGFYCETGRIGHPESQLAGIALGKKKYGTAEENNDRSGYVRASSIDQVGHPKSAE
jgi:hypothetical protein